MVSTIDWYYASIIAGLIFAVVSILEKRLIGLLQTLTVFLAVFAAVAVGRSAFLFAVASYSGISLNPAGIAWALVAGVSMSLAISLYLYALSLEDVSRVVPLFSTTPIFTFAIASLVFGERATATQIFGLLVATAGVVVISLKPEARKVGFISMKAFVAVMATAFVIAWLFVAMDKASQHIDPVSIEAVKSLCSGVLVGLLTWRAKSFRLARMALADREALVLVVAIYGVGAGVVMLLIAYAVSIGPVGPVSTVTTALAPVVVLTAATILGKWGRGYIIENTDSRTLMLKVVGTGLVILGLIALRT